MQKLLNQSKDISQENIKKVEELFPNCVTETYDQDGNLVRSIDFDILRQDLSDHIVDGPKERYQFNWPGKREAILLANAPTTNTLRPLPEKSVDFENTKNVYIEGDNLEALKILRETYMGKIKMIYIDPPYNTGNDFVYKDDFKESTEEYLKSSGNIDEEGNRMAVNGESNGRFHSDWLNMMYPRLILARDLLTDDGVIFISIDDNELDDLIKLTNEVFGKDKMLGCFPRITKKAGKTTDAIAKNHDYVLSYSKGSNPSIILPFHTDDGFCFSDEFKTQRGKYKLNQTLDYDSLQYSPSLDYPINIDGEIFYPGQSYQKYLERKQGKHARADWEWRWSKELFDFGYRNGFIVIKKHGGTSRIYTKTYQNCKISKNSAGFYIEYIQRTKAISSLEFISNDYSNDNSKKNLVSLFGSGVFDYSKPITLLKFLIKYFSSENDTILDFFSGSGTTADAVIRLNADDRAERKFILVQLPEQCVSDTDAYKAGYKTICDIGEDRIRKSGRKIKEDSPLTTQGLDIGFRVYKIDSSNMKNISNTPKDTQLSLLENADSAIKPDRNSLDLVTQVMLQLGITLDAEIKIGKCAGGGEYYAINGNDLICCFDKNISESDIEEIARMQPLNVAFRDDSFASDQDEVNCEQIFKTLSPNTGKNIFVL